MHLDDIHYILEILEDAVLNKDWEPVEEAQQYLRDYLKDRGSKYSEEE
jgi:hypothetical protein